MAASVPITDHPLSPDGPPQTTRNARRKGSVAVDASSQPLRVTSYFALKMQSEERAASSQSNSVEASPARRKPLNGGVSRMPIANLFNTPTSNDNEGLISTSPSPSATSRSEASGSRVRHRPSFSLAIPPSHLEGVTPVQIATPPRTALPDFPTPVAGPSRSQAPTLTTSPKDDARLAVIPPLVQSQIISTRWHTLSDDELQSTIVGLGEGHAMQSPADDPVFHPYDSTIRVLSAALQKLNDRYLELESQLRLRSEEEDRRRRQAERRVKRLKPPIRDDIARRVLDAAFAPAGQDTPSGTLSPSDSVSSRDLNRDIILMTPGGIVAFQLFAASYDRYIQPPSNARLP